MDDFELTLLFLLLLVLFVIFGLDRPNRFSPLRLFFDWALLTIISYMALELTYF